jgi:hypothetical protein
MISDGIGDLSCLEGYREWIQDYERLKADEAKGENLVISSSQSYDPSAINFKVLFIINEKCLN